MQELADTLQRNFVRLAILVGGAFVIVALIVGSLCAYLHRKAD